MPTFIVTAVFFALLFGVARWSKRHIESVEDYVVAGRRLPWSLATGSLVATWFGAGTLLTSADEVRERGLEAAALDPLGAGVCLILAGLFFAARLWNMNLLTLSDFFAVRFGARAEVCSAILMIPAYFGWIAAQFVALGHVFHLWFGVEIHLAIAGSAAIGLAYTYTGGMWAVTLTDTLQIVLVVLGLAVLLHVTGSALVPGAGFLGLTRIAHDVPADKLVPIPTQTLRETTRWIGVFAAGALGNLPSQELTQRMFAARSAKVARAACIASGVFYLSLGLAPLALGLAGDILLPDLRDRGTLPMLAALFMHPWIAAVFAVTIMSAVLSTITSAVLAPANVLAHNLLRRVVPLERDSLTLHRASVGFVTAVSLALAYVGEDAYALLESSYELGMVSLLAPLVFGLYGRRRSEVAALASMVVGTALWLVHVVLGLDGFLGVAVLPQGLMSLAIATTTYAVAARVAV